MGEGNKHGGIQTAGEPRFHNILPCGLTYAVILFGGGISRKGYVLYAVPVSNPANLRPAENTP